MLYKITSHKILKRGMYYLLFTDCYKSYLKPFRKHGAQFRSQDVDSILLGFTCQHVNLVGSMGRKE